MSINLLPAIGVALTIAVFGSITLLSSAASAAAVIISQSGDDDFEKDLLFALEADTSASKFWKELKDLRDTSDTRGIERLFKAKVFAAESAFVCCEVAYATSNNRAFVDVLTGLAEGIDEAQGAKSFIKRVEFMRSLGQDDRNLRLDAMRKFQDAMNLMANPPKGKDADRGEVKKIEDLINSGLTVFRDLKDTAYIARSLRLRAILFDGLHQFQKAVEDIDKAMDLWVESDLPKNSEKYVYLVDRRRQLISEGFDPDRPAGGPKASEKEVERNTSRSFVGGSSPTDAEGLRIKHDIKMKKFKTMSFSGSLPYIWWDTFLGEGDCTSADAPFGLTPWGRKIHFVRKGSDVSVDWDKDGEGDTKLRLTSKPTLIEIPQDPADPKSQTVAFAIATGQQEETMFDVDLNNAPTQKYTALRFRGVSYLEGKIAGESISIVDDNDTGIFGDTIEIYDGYINQNTPPPYRGLDGMVIGKSKVAGPFSDVAAIDGVFHAINFDREKLTLSAQPLDLDTGRVVVENASRMPLTHLIISELEALTGSHFNVADSPKDGLEVPVGTYEISGGLVTNGKEGTSYEAILITKGKSENFKVEKGETVTLKIGAPFAFDFKGTSSGNEFKIMGESVQVFGASGECYARFYDEVPIPDVSVRVGSKIVVKDESMGKVGLAEYQASASGRILLYHPIDFKTEVRGDGIQARLTLKKHKLLNSKIESDWK